MKYLMSSVVLIVIMISCDTGQGNNNQTTDSLQYFVNNLRDSIKKYPDNKEFFFKLADLFQNEGNYKAAIRVLDSMNIQQGDSVNLRLYFDYLFKRSELLELSGDTTNAIKTLELFVIPGELTLSGLRLANLYARTKDPKAISFCEAMKKNDKSGKDPNPDFLKGIYYINIGEDEKAIAQFDQCILKEYNFLDAHIEKGKVLYNQKKFMEALKVFDLTLTLSISYAEAFFWKAKCQEALGQLQAAKLNYQRAYGLDKNLTEAKKAAERIIN